MKDERIVRVGFTVTGVVQGVGFRPFVHATAVKHGLTGFIRNTPRGVEIDIEGSRAAVAAFEHDLEHRAPVLARIDSIAKTVGAASSDNRKYATFDILESNRAGKPAALISPDICTCDDCLGELFDRRDRRYRYPFVNCTNCGPRFTIIRGLPYDRPNTTMASFAMCPDCNGEYHDPGDRRFHAQPNACPVCGPELRCADESGSRIDGDPVGAAIRALKDGRIVALKGLGGFHLAVDARDEEAVRRLRERKFRGEKPFAIMVGDVATARRLVDLSPGEEAALESRERPIVLARKKRSGDAVHAAPSVAPDNPCLGVMLPYTPLHYLLFFDPGSGGGYHAGKPLFTALVMTSGNISEEPICKDNDEALERLAGIADLFLLHDRDIHVRSDDSVVTSIGGDVSFARRSRGYAPLPVRLNGNQPQSLALGGELKNTLCVTDGDRAFISQHIGDLENIPTLGFFEEAVGHFTRILDIRPRIFAYDLHPDYLSTRFLFERILENGGGGEFVTVGVQHHHAHIASVLAEHGCGGPVIGFSLDGTGYGLDGTVWGGEVLVATATAFRRFAHVKTVPMPGGTAAVREPWRMAFSHLRDAFGGDFRELGLPCLDLRPENEYELLDTAVEHGVNSPMTSAMGRLFDAAASVLDIRHVSAFEGQAAMLLESWADTTPDASPLPFSIHVENGGGELSCPRLGGFAESEAVESTIPVTDRRLVIDYAPTFRALADGMRKGASRASLAASFHAAVVESLADVASAARDLTGVSVAALSGGCWQNRILSERFAEILAGRGFTVLRNRLVPVNDGGISLGQAWVAVRIAGGRLR